MEVYTPIPEDVIRRAPRPVRSAGWLLLAAVLAFVAVPVVRYTFNVGMPPDFHNYGTVETRYGTAGVFCGGESGPPCGEGTRLELATCDYEVRTSVTTHTGRVIAVFTSSTVRARDLVAKRPPSGDKWVLACGNAAMIRGGPAHLRPDE